MIDLFTPAETNVDPSGAPYQLAPVAQRLPAPPQTHVETPLGRVTFMLNVDQVPLLVPAACTAATLPDHGREVWADTPFGPLHALLARPWLLMSTWMDLEDCWALVWRMRLSRPVHELSFTIDWQPLITGISGGPDPDQDCACQSWQDPHWRLSLGTEGTAPLLQRALSSDWLPPHLARTEQANHGSWISYRPTGVTITLNQLGPGDTIGLHGACAWNRINSPSEKLRAALTLDYRQIISGARGARSVRSKHSP